MNIAKILVDGAGPLGSLSAARLQQGSNHVSILARGQRLDELREYGIVLVDVLTQEQTVTRFVISIIIVQRESVTER
jgi:2-dehydropantoate 2-reductase